MVEFVNKTPFIRRTGIQNRRSHPRSHHIQVYIRHNRSIRRNSWVYSDGIRKACDPRHHLEPRAGPSSSRPPGSLRGRQPGSRSKNASRIIGVKGWTILLASSLFMVGEGVVGTLEAAETWIDWWTFDEAGTYLYPGRWSSSGQVKSFVVMVSLSISYDLIDRQY